MRRTRLIDRGREKAYRSYLLRCWQERAATPKQGAVWRFSLTIIAETQAQHGFSSFEALIDFLEAELGLRIR